MSVDHPYVRAHLLQNVEQHGHVGYLGNVFYPARSLDHEGGRYYSYGCILRTADLDLAVQRSASVDDVLSHRFTFQLYPIIKVRKKSAVNIV